MQHVFPNWVRTDLEKGCVIGFEPVENAEGKALSVQWKGTIPKLLNGTIVRMHEIANAGKPILDGIQRRAHSPMWKSTEAGEPTQRLRHVLKDVAIMRKDRERRFAHDERSHLIVLHSAIDEAICVVKYSG
jgi:hypothetical protein